MFTYEIGYGSPEDSGCHTLLHEEKYTDDQLADIVAEAVIAVIKLEKKCTYASVHSYAGIHDAVGEWLIDNKGFTVLQAQATWYCFGWASLFTTDDWPSYRDETLNKLVIKVFEAGYTVDDDDYLKSF